MTSQTTHGPWRGLDFDPTTNLTRTAVLCPNGWLLLEWSAVDSDVGDSHQLLTHEVYGIVPGSAVAIVEAYESQNLGPADYGLDEWPESRLFIGRLERNHHEDGVDWVVELLVGNDGELAFADPLPTAECPRCGRQAPIFPCGQCKAEMCELCGEDHTPPDCPPAWAAHQQAMADTDRLMRDMPPEIRLPAGGYEATYRLFSLGGPAMPSRGGLIHLPPEHVAALTAGKSIIWPAESTSPGAPRVVLGGPSPTPSAAEACAASRRAFGNTARGLRCISCGHGEGCSIGQAADELLHADLLRDEAARLRRLGREFRQLREAAGFGMRGLASALDVPVTTISIIERGGASRPDPALRAALHPAGACTCGAGGASGTCEWCQMDQARSDSEDTEVDRV